MQEAKVQYSHLREGGYTGRVRRAVKKDDRGNVTDWQVFPVRSWTAARREMWLPLMEARLWAQLRDWSIVQTRGDNGQGQEDTPVEEGFVEYIGRRRAPFTQRMGKFPVRRWCCIPPDAAKWLPIEEARMWDQQREWKMSRTRVVETPSAPMGATVAAPAPQAQPIASLLESAGAEVRRLRAKEEEEEEGAAFCISDSGVVHKRGCIQWPKYPLEEFGTFAEAINSEEYGQAENARVHKACCGEFLERQLAEDTEKIEGALEQMNALGESYGIQAQEA
jgi:hypothetical protein